MVVAGNTKNKIIVAVAMGLFMLLETAYVTRNYGGQAFGIMAIVANLIMFVGLITGFIGNYIFKWKLENVYLALGITMGLVFMIIFPVYVVPDEPVHLNTAYELSNKMMGIGSPAEGVYYRACDRTLPLTVRYTISQFNEYYAHLFEPTGNTSLIVRDEGTVATMFYQYLPAAVGITIGRLLNLNTLMTFLLGRLMNLACFITAVYFAIKLLPVGKMLLLTIALLPMMLQQGMSYSYDWFINAASILLTVFTVRAVMKRNSEEKISIFEYVALAILSFLLFPLKGKVYFAMSLMPWILLFLPAGPVKGITKKIFKIVLLVFVLLIAAFLVFRTIRGGDLVAEPENILSWAQLQGYTIQFFINHPFALFDVFRKTIFQYGSSLMDSCVGDNFGWLEINLFRPVLQLLYLCIFLAVLKVKDEPEYFTGKQRAAVLICSGISICSVFGAMLLRYSPVGMAIMGVQGRYFIPTELAVLLGIRGSWITKERWVDQGVLFMLIVALNLTANLLILYYS